MQTKLISAGNFSAERNAGKSKCHSEIPSRSSNPSRLRIPERFQEPIGKKARIRRSLFALSKSNDLTTLGVISSLLRIFIPDVPFDPVIRQHHFCCENQHRENSHHSEGLFSHLQERFPLAITMRRFNV